ncbi:MAG TPA: hypothetical protein VIK30_10525 [Polyangia bacterium]
MTGRAKVWFLSALAALAAVLPACGAGTPTARGFGSRQVLPIRDSTFAFYESGPQTIGYGTYADGGYNNATIDLMADRDAGQPDADAGADAGLGLDICDQAFGMTDQTLLITDPQTGQQTSIDDVFQVLECSGAGPTLTLLRVDANSALTLWSGPAGALQEIALSVTIAQFFYVANNKGDATAIVLGTPAGQPDAVGLYAIDLGSFAVTTLVPPTLGTAAWANGATATANPLSSTSLILPLGVTEQLLSRVGASQQYSYARAMGDGSAIMFTGTFPSGPASELALFEIPPSATVGAGAEGTTRGPANATWAYQLDDSAAQQFSLVVWDNGHQQLIPCPLPAPTYQTGVSTPDGTKILYGAPSFIGTPLGVPGPLVVVSLPTGSPGSAGACTILAPGDVEEAGFSTDSSAVFWRIKTEVGLSSTLWTAAADGTGARVVGTGAIEQPRYVSGTQLEFELGSALVWVDTTDTQNNVHTIVEEIFGTAIDLQGPWIVIGYDYSSQDATGTLGLVNRDGGQKRPISTEVSLYEEIAVASNQTAIFNDPPPDSGLPTAQQIAYLVRGRNPSPQDGVWVATINQADLH